MAAASTSAAGPQAHIQALPAHLVTQTLPITVRQASSNVCGAPTQVVCQDFADRTLVVVSQVGKVGYLTQVNMHRRPSHFASAAALELDDLDDVQPAPAATAIQAASSAPLGFDQATLLGSCQQQRLMGTHPPGQRSLYDLYNVHIAARAQHALAQQHSADGRAESTGALTDKPVVVGLALSSNGKHTSRLQSTVDDGGDDDDDDFDVLASDERERFQGILALVERACRSSSVDEARSVSDAVE